jgi:hypothetical protein
MGRIRGADPKEQGLFAGWFTRLVYAMTRRKLGRVVDPVRVIAHHPGILWGYGQMEQSLASASRVDPELKHLGELRVATLVGCPF